MQVTFRTKLSAIVAIAMVALLAVIFGSTVIGIRQARDLNDVESRLVPKLHLGPQLEAEFDRLSRGMQDAVAAQDAPALAATMQNRDRLFELIGSSGNALELREAATLRWAIQDYYQLARDVSQRLLAGETGENLVRDIAEMQQRQQKARSAIKKASGFEPRELAAGFAAVRDANRSADTFRLAIGLGGLLCVVLLSVAVSRGMLRALGHLSGGFARFGTGDFSQPIPVLGTDELGGAAKEANQMAAQLQKLAEQRDRADWLKVGQAGLSDELRGELDTTSVAGRALSSLATTIGARAAAFYASTESDGWTLMAHHALAPTHGSTAEGTPVRSFRSGEGLVGQVASTGEILVVDDPPPGYLDVRSGLGGASPRSIVLLPLVRLGKTVAVLEFALFVPCSSETRELLASIRETLVIAFEAAKSRAATRDLLQRTQQLAERLAAQEEELRLNNQELQDQQEELRRANEELEAQRQTLSHKNTELEEARRRVQAKAEEVEKVSSYKSQFLANMSHELRTPLNSMLLLSHLLGENEAGNLSAKQVEHSKAIHSAGQDLLALINQVLDLSKIEAGKQELDVESVEIEHFAAYARRIAGALASDKGLRLVVEVSPTLPKNIATDKRRVERILTNLLGNAIKFTERGEVALRIERPPPETTFSRSELSADCVIAFSVSDTGIGIATEGRDRVFAPFEQLEARTDRRYSGTGLGLAIARESAGLLGGELRLMESTPGRGSTFVCYLPDLGRPAERVNGARVVTSRPAGEVSDDRGSLSPGEPYLLIVEDDPILSEQLVDVIRARGFKALAVGQGEQAVAMAKRNPPLGIILDIKLPDIDGWTVMDRLRLDDATRTVPVHFVSAIDAPERGFALGAVGYLTKPASRGELIAAVRTLIKSASGPERILVVEDDLVGGQSVAQLLRGEGLEADLVKSAGDALTSVKSRDYRCIVLDLGLPDMDGLELLEKLRECTTKEMPRVVVHTGRALTKKETHHLEAYAQAVILKDGSSAERLLDEVRLFLRHVKEGLGTDGSIRGVEAAEPDVSLAGIKLLVAEDDMRTVYALSALLRGKGADVVVAETGREALAMLESHPDVHGVLMDVMMPEMDGYEAIRRLRIDPRFASLPVIALTAKAMKGERERCLEAGASDYLTKPVDTRRLLTALQDWLRAGESRNAGRRH